MSTPIDQYKVYRDTYNVVSVLDMTEDSQLVLETCEMSDIEFEEKWYEVAEVLYLELDLIARDEAFILLREAERVDYS